MIAGRSHFGICYGELSRTIPEFRRADGQNPRREAEGMRMPSSLSRGITPTTFKQMVKTLVSKKTEERNRFRKTPPRQPLLLLTPHTLPKKVKRRIFFLFQLGFPTHCW